MRSRRAGRAGLVLWCSWLAVPFALGCDRNVGTLEMRLLPADGEALNSLVASVRVRIETRESGVLVRELPFELGGTASFPGVPVGTGVIELQALTLSGLERSRGRSLPVAFGPGGTLVDLYVARVEQFSPAAAPLEGPNARGGHSAVPLDDGRVLLVGGARSLVVHAGSGPEEPPWAELGEPVAGADLFDPTSGRVVAAGSCPADGAVGNEPLCLRIPRLGAAVAGSSDGSTLVVGGVDPRDGSAVVQVERFGASRLWSEVVGGPIQARTGAGLVATPRGALLVGGWEGPALDRPSAAAVLLTAGGASEPEMVLECARAEPEVVVVGDEAVLFGGFGEEGLRRDYERISLDPVRSLGCVPLPPEVQPRAGARAVALGHSTVVIVGGVEENGAMSREVDVLDVRTSTFCPVLELTEARYLHALAPLPDGTVLVVGGLSSWTLELLHLPRGSPRIDLGLVTAVLEAAAREPRRLDCGDVPSAAERDVRALKWPRIAPTATALANGMVLVAGGFGMEADELPPRPLDQHEIFVP